MQRCSDRAIPKPRIFEQEYPPYFEATPTPAFDAARLQALRRLGGSQRVFADALNASIGAVRVWEYGRHVPEGPAGWLLELGSGNRSCSLIRT